MFQELIDSEIMFLQFWMIFAKKLCVVATQSVHRCTSVRLVNIIHMMRMVTGIYSLRVVYVLWMQPARTPCSSETLDSFSFFRVIKSSLQTVHFQVPTSMNFALFFCTSFLYLHFFVFYLQKTFLLIHFRLSLRSTPWAATTWKQSFFRLVGSGEGREEKSLKLPSTTHKWDANRMSFKLFFFTSP